jgi:replicative DNA helicase
MAEKKLRIPPQNKDAEMALLGSIMLKPDSIHEINDVIFDDTFYFDKHKLVFRTMTELFKKQVPIDLLSMASRLKENGDLEKIGGQSYLVELTEIVPSAANIKHYADITLKKSMMRNLIDASEYISHLGFDESGELEEILDKAEKKVYDVTNFSTTQKFVELKDELAEAWERFDRLHKSDGGMRGVPSGFFAIDNLLAGFQPSDLIILAARPSTGKTALCLDIARNAAVEHGKKVGVFSLEMSSQQLVDRMVAAQASVDAWKLRTGKLTSEDDFTSLRQALDKLSQAPIFIDDQPGNNILKMRSVARRLQREKGLDLIIVDYLQLMSPVGNFKADSTVQQITEISRSLKHLARDLKVPVIALSQLSRAVEQRGGKPRLSDLRDSGSIEQDADVVMFLHREKDESGERAKVNTTEVLIEKHRNGATGSVELYFNDKKATFQSIEKSEYGSESGGGDDGFGDF